jgi:hypothetical protein
MNQKQFRQFVVGFCEEVEINFRDGRCTNAEGQFALHTLSRMCEVALEDFESVTVIEGFEEKFLK